MSTFTRSHPYLSKIKERLLLTAPSSTKRTYHISLEVSALPFEVGDSVAIFPDNDSKIVSSLLDRMKFSGQEEIFDTRTSSKLSLHEFLLKKANLMKTNSAFLKLLQASGEAVASLLENKAELNLFLQSNSLLDILKKFPKALFSPQELVSTLMPLMPRFYSIASSKKVYQDEIHLTIAYLTYTARGEIRHGVASHFLCEQALLGSTSIPIYIQASNGFTLPPPDASMILIGPGTGVAPFRAFLQERLATQARGRNWLFFGERNRASDFYYESFFTELVHQNFLRLDTAFSRDSKDKVYVQHRLLENAASVWDWLKNGAYLYVCGDAEKMAKDVDLALQQIVKTQGNFTEEEARLYLKQLRAEKRYLLDVY